MRIDNNMMSGMDTLEQTSRKKNVEKVSANDKQNSSVVESDEVSISEKGKDVSEMTRTLKEMPDVRADKVADLKERIANGTYNISGKDIASKIINTALEDGFLLFSIGKFFHKLSLKYGDKPFKEGIYGA